MAPLARLRLQLTVWYAGVFTLVFALLGGGLFLTIRQQMSRHVDKSLGAAAASLEQAARIRETERASAHGAVVDAVDELHIPERSLYLLDEEGHAIKPAAVPVWIRDAAQQAVQSQHGYRDLNAPDGRDLRIYAERFTGTTRAIEREAARGGGIVGDLLPLARADSGERPVVREPLYLDDVAAGAVDAVRALATSKGITLEVGAFEEAKIAGDGELVRQLVLIVLDNAIKFTPAGGHVRLNVSVEDGRAAVVVTDTGMGIPAEQLPHVFERFYRGDPARRAADGTGLGLAIARWIAEVHGARIDIGSEPGVGTRVTLGFPLAF